MKKICAIFLALILNCQVFAAQTGHIGIQELSDEINFEFSQAKSPKEIEALAHHYTLQLQEIIAPMTAQEKLDLINEILSTSHSRAATDMKELFQIVNFKVLSPQEQ